MKYALNLNEENRILSATYEKYAPANAILVDTLPENDISDYLYINNEYVYSPLVSDEEKLNKEKQIKKQQLSSACYSTITNGIDVETTQGLEHFSLTELDQINLNMAFIAIQNGAVEYLYHADGQLCRSFSAEEIIAISEASNTFKSYHTTLCNHLFKQLNLCTTSEEIAAINYSIESLNEELLNSFNNLIEEVNT